ncbi:hypothetical protein [Corynebacterium pacaense]|uniref:hypothetical protein n=1 Tax=Corynebacterium pacaense TaxID=1816684 RepID=UPI0009BAE054|nr:hypothetical protein [Corynebacterium pacaense]
MSPLNLDHGRKLVAALCLVALLLLVLMLSTDDRVAKPMAINGDSLGQVSGETPEQYRQRAAMTLESATGPAFALVTFEQPVAPELAATELEPLARVSAITLDGSTPVELPEPTGTEGRREVFDRAIAQADRRMDGLAPQHIDAAVVYDSGANLRAVAQRGGVFAVEVLPTDAAWGRFGVRPVTVSR